MPKPKPVGSHRRPSLAAIRVVHLELPVLRQMSLDLGSQIRAHRSAPEIAAHLRAARKSLEQAIKAARSYPPAEGG